MVLLGVLTSALAGVPSGAVRDGTPDAVNLVKARQVKRQRAFTWQPWSPETFAAAKAAGKFILVDGAAEWCHWCHVMDETTYLDPEVGALLTERFVAIRVDIDARPDLAERYGEWGWPATIVLSPDAQEVGKYRGYLRPDQLKQLLRDVAAAPTTPHEAWNTLEQLPANDASMGWVCAKVTHELDRFFDPEEGGWGFRQKTPIGMNVEFELLRAAHGDPSALERVRLTLRKQRALIDPVWGGLSQYSAASHWKEPHFEKLMGYQAPVIEALARASSATGDLDLRADAEHIASFVERFLTRADGAFFTNQDADLGAHDRTTRFVDGHVYHSLDDAGRRKLGLPWVDTHVYARENGLAIAALVALYEATRDQQYLTRARAAAEVMLGSHVMADGAVKHDAGDSTGAYLADGAALGRALTRLAEVTHDARYLDVAQRIGTRLWTLHAPASGALFERTLDPDAAGVFAHRQTPFAHNVTAARFFLGLGRLTHDEVWRQRGRSVLEAIATPQLLDNEGRFLGEFLIAADEAGLYPWPSASGLTR